MKLLTTEYLDKLKTASHETTCPDCNGEGRVDEIDYSKVNSATIDIPYKSVPCDKCKGEGKIEMEDEEEE